MKLKIALYIIYIFFLHIYIHHFTILLKVVQRKRYVLEYRDVFPNRRCFTKRRFLHKLMILQTATIYFQAAPCVRTAMYYVLPNSDELPNSAVLPNSAMLPNRDVLPNSDVLPKAMCSHRAMRSQRRAP